MSVTAEVRHPSNSLAHELRLHDARFAVLGHEVSGEALPLLVGPLLPDTCRVLDVGAMRVVIMRDGHRDVFWDLRIIGFSSQVWAVRDTFPEETDVLRQRVVQYVADVVPLGKRRQTFPRFVATSSRIWYRLRCR